MQVLDYLKIAGTYDKTRHTGQATTRVSLVTNFTDDLLAKIMTGLMASEGILPDVYQVPFKQYLFALKDPTSPLVQHQAEVTCIFFDVNPHGVSEFLADDKHMGEVLEDIENYCRSAKGEVLLNTLSVPSSRQHGRLLKESQLHRLVEGFNTRARQLAEQLPNLALIDTNLLVRVLGERHIRDLRGSYAFSQPFSGDFLLSVAREWMTHVRALRGTFHKCIVLDLDQVLWGHIVGEVGPLGIQLGHEYPGNAYQQFQRLLLEMHERGIILAINSRNNESDVDEVFEKNPYMILQKRHFASIVANWKTKAENLQTIANELNIGLDSMLFIDDDPVNRELVRAQLPQVLVPEWSMPPEEYSEALLDLDVFHSRAQTEEDAARGAMYAAERERKSLQTHMPTLEEYLATLNVRVHISCNDRAQIPRLAQLTQKTNQYNLSTRRSSEQELEAWIAESAYVYSGAVEDIFGPYGITIMAIFHPRSSTHIELTTFLMSCRVMGRAVEHAFFRAVVEELSRRGYTQLTASFVPSTKNAPIRHFLPEQGAREVEKKDSGEITYELSIPEYLLRSKKEAHAIEIILNQI